MGLRSPHHFSAAGPTKPSRNSLVVGENLFIVSVTCTGLLENNMCGGSVL
jgi:hypothetical protein